MVVVFTGILCIWMKLTVNNDNNRASESLWRKCSFFAQNTLTLPVCVCVWQGKFFFWWRNSLNFHIFELKEEKSSKGVNYLHRHSIFYLFFFFLLLSNNDDYCFWAIFYYYQFFFFIFLILIVLNMNRTKEMEKNQSIDRARDIHG